MTGAATAHQHDPPAEALECARNGRHREAIALCHERLAEAPGDPGALRLLAQLWLQAGQATAAVLLLERPVRSRPDDPALLSQFGAALAAAGSSDAAADAYARALAQDPASSDAQFGLLDLGRTAELEDALRAAAQARLEDPSPYIGLANVQLETGRPDAAQASFERAIELAPRSRQAHARSGSRLAMTKQDERAARVYRWGLALNPGDPVLTHMLSALEGGRGPDRASDEYVAQQFDEFAESFDETLVERLGYRAPQLVMEALEDWLPAAGEPRLAVLDAGCGTGLCGPLLRPFAQRLVGIDLSRKMLSVAASKSAYDELRAGELVQAMEAEPGAYDLVVVTDVLPYFGRLEDLFEAAAGSVRPGGRVAVSAERHAGAGYALRSSGRYAHSADYLSDAAAGAGLAAIEIRECSIRLEAGVPTPGYIAVFAASS